MENSRHDYPELKSHSTDIFLRAREKWVQFRHVVFAVSFLIKLQMYRNPERNVKITHIISPSNE